MSGGAAAVGTGAGARFVARHELCYPGTGRGQACGQRRGAAPRREAVAFSGEAWGSLAGGRGPARCRAGGGTRGEGPRGGSASATVRVPTELGPGAGRGLGAGRAGGAAARQTVDVESVGSAAGRGVRGEGHVVEDRGEVGPATGGGWAPGWAVLRPRRHMGTSCASVRAERRAWGLGPADTGNVSPPWGGHRERRRGVPGVPELVTLGEVGRASQVDSQVRRGRRAGPWGGCVRGMSGER